MEIIPGTEVNPFYSSRGWRIHWMLLMVFMIANCVLSPKVPEVLTLGQPLIQPGENLLLRSLLVVVLGWNFCGFMIGNFLSLLPVKKYSYAQKYGKICMLTMMAIQAAGLGFCLLRLAQ